jgi:hypothetical protein
VGNEEGNAEGNEEGNASGRPKNGFAAFAGSDLFGSAELTLTALES